MVHENEQRAHPARCGPDPRTGANGEWHYGAVIPSHPSLLPRSVFARVGAAVTLGIALVLGGGLAARADVICVDDGCDGGLWQTARGAADDVSYWGMGAGHNCTNYVAWKLISNGVARPSTNPGNAADWATNAAADGYLVDGIPAVGAVAQWDAFAAGSPLEGHVAYIERVNDDGTILVSEDAWHADGSGPLRLRTVPAASVSHVIHYADTSAWLRQVVAAPGRWSQRSTGLLADASLISAVSMGGRAPLVAFTQNGELHIAGADASGWHDSATGLASHARALTAVNMGGSFPMVVSLEGTRLMVSSRSTAGWSTMYTGVDISGEMSAVNAGGPWPTVLVSQGGTLYSVTNNGTGWFVASTGVEVAGPITATSTVGTLVDAYSVEDGTLYRLWFDGTWWHRDSTGVETRGTAAAVASDGTSQIVLSENGSLSLVFRDSLGWHERPTGVAAGASMTAVDMGGMYPVVLQTG
jgi:hypothetical protein